MTRSTTVVILLSVCLVKFIETRIEGFIVGGELSNINDFPHSVFLSIKVENSSLICGGSVLNQVIVITAGHCVSKCKSPWDITAYTASETKHKGHATKVTDLTIHEKYTEVGEGYDIALLKLEKNLTFSDKVKRVALGSNSLIYKTGVVAGWGRIDIEGTRGKLLKHVKQEIIDYEECFKLLNGVPRGVICGRELTGMSYPEKGDSGSALVVNDFIQIGLVSFKNRKYSNETVVYTDLSYYHAWIEENVELLVCSSKEDS